jgi:hypothetical protein
MADLDAGCWQVKMNQASKEKMAFFMPNRKNHFNSMPMGATDAHAAFAAMVSKLEVNRDNLHEMRCEKSMDAKWARLKEKMEAATKEMKQKRAKAGNNKDQTTLPFPSDTISKPFEPMWQRPLETDPMPGSG